MDTHKIAYINSCKSTQSAPYDKCERGFFVWYFTWLLLGDRNKAVLSGRNPEAWTSSREICIYLF